MEEIRKIIRETLEEMAKEQRYVATMDFYVWAANDEEAVAQAKAIAAEIDSKYDNRASINQMGKEPGGIGNYTPIDFTKE